MKTVRLGLAAIFVCNLAFAQQPGKDEPSQGGRPLSAWIEDLKDESPVIREEALEIIGVMGTSAARAADTIRPLLKDASASMRLRAAVALWKVEQKEEPILPILIAAAAGRDRNIRLLLVDAIQQTAFNSKEVGGILIECLTGADEAVRFRATSALLTLPDSAAVPALSAGLNHKDSAVVQQVLHLASIRGPRAAGAADVIRRHLKARNPYLQLAAAQALRKIAPDADAITPVLVELSKLPDAYLHSQALVALTSILPAPPAAIPVFEAALKDRDPHVRVNAARALYEHDQRTRELLPILLEALSKERYPLPQSEASEVLARMTGDAKTIVPAVLDSIREANRVNQTPSFGVFHVLSYMGDEGTKAMEKAFTLWQPGRKNLLITAIAQAKPKGISVLIKAFPNEAAHEQMQILGAMSYSELPDSAIPLLTELLKTHDMQRCSRALSVLPGLGFRAKQMTPLLLEVFKDEKHHIFVRKHAAGLAGRRTADRKLVVPVMIEALKDPQPREELRQQAAATMAQIGPEAREALPLLQETLKTARGAFRGHVLDALWQIAPADPKLPVMIVEHFKAEMAVPPRDYSEPLRLLGQLGPEAKGALPELLKALEASQEPNLKISLLDALGRIGPAAKEAIPLLKEQLAGSDHHYHSIVCAALLAVGCTDKEVALTLERLIDRTSKAPHRRWEALELLEQMGPAAAPALPGLMRIWRTEPATFNFERGRLAAALVRLDPKAVLRTISWLREQGRDVHAYGAAQVIAVLARLDLKAVEGIPGLLRLLRDEKIVNRHLLIEALGDLGPAAKEAVPALETILKGGQFAGDKSEAAQSQRIQMRVSAARALSRIDPKKTLTAVAGLGGVLSDAGESPLPYYRKMAVPVLASLGPAAKPALPALANFYGEMDGLTRRETLDAMRKIDPRSPERLGR